MVSTAGGWVAGGPGASGDGIKMPKTTLAEHPKKFGARILASKKTTGHQKNHQDRHKKDTKKGTKKDTKNNNKKNSISAQ